VKADCPDGDPHSFRADFDRHVGGGPLSYRHSAELDTFPFDWQRDPDLGEQLVGLADGHERALKEVAEVHEAPTAIRCELYRCPKRRQESGGIGTGLGETEVAPDSPHVANTDIGEPPFQLNERWQRGCDERVPFQASMCDAGADNQRTVLDANFVGEAPAIDKMVERSQAELHERQ
jgi:hypothetical protein